MGLPLHRLNLTETQRAQVKTVFGSHQEEMTGLGDKMRAARKALHAVVAADQFDDQDQELELTRDGY